MLSDALIDSRFITKCDFSTIYGPDRHINSERAKRHWQASKKRHWKRKIWGPSRECQNKAINPLKNLRQKGKVQQQAQAKSGVKKRVKLLFILYSNRFVSISLPPEPELACFMHNWLWNWKIRRRHWQISSPSCNSRFYGPPWLHHRTRTTEREFKIRFYASPAGQCC